MDLVTMFSGIHWDAIAKIVGIDILLGGDNAVVIAMACAGVSLAHRKKAIVWGTAAAILMRIIVLIMAAFLIAIPFVKVFAGLLLFWIGFKLVSGEDDEAHIDSPERVWDAIKTIAMADLVMSIDNVFAVTGASQSTGDHSVYYAIAGILLSIPFIVFGASMISKVMDRFPVIIWAGAGLLGWVGAEMIVSDPVVNSYIDAAVGHLGELADYVIKGAGFLTVLIAAWAFGKNKEEVTA